MGSTQFRVNRWLPAVIGVGWCGFGVVSVVHLIVHGMSAGWLVAAVVGFAGGLFELWLAFRPGGPGTTRIFDGFGFGNAQARQQQRLGVGTIVGREDHTPAKASRLRTVGLTLDFVSFGAFVVLTSTHHHPGPALVVPIAVVFVIGLVLNLIGTYVRRPEQTA